MLRLPAIGISVSPREGQKKTLFRVTDLILSHYKQEEFTDSAAKEVARSKTLSSVSLWPKLHSIQYSQECLEVTVNTPIYRRYLGYQITWDIHEARQRLECLKKERPHVIQATELERPGYPSRLEPRWCHHDNGVWQYQTWSCTLSGLAKLMPHPLSGTGMLTLYLCILDIFEWVTSLFTVTKYLTIINFRGKLYFPL